MKKLLYVVGGLTLLLLVIAIAGYIYLNAAYPKVSPAEEITIEPTPERLARGEYLVNHVTICFECHAAKDLTRFGGPIVAGTEGKGGTPFAGDHGVIYPPNITPAALGDWRDGEIMRAITAGVNKDGRALAPMMPFTEYRYLAQEDIRSIVAYLRTLTPVENTVPEPKLNFPLNLIFNTLPADPEPAMRPDPSDSVATGRYLARIAGCQFCHTPVEQGAPIAGREFAGGHEFPDPKLGTVRSANISPDMETGIGSWTRSAFVARFKAYADPASHIPVAPGEFQTVMPWIQYAEMTDADLSAIYAYLRTVQAQKNTVVRFTAPE